MSVDATNSSFVRRQAAGFEEGLVPGFVASLKFAGQGFRSWSKRITTRLSSCVAKSVDNCTCRRKQDEEEWPWRKLWQSKRFP